MKNELKMLVVYFLFTTFFLLVVSSLLYAVQGSLYWPSAILIGGIIGSLVGKLGLLVWNYFSYSRLAEDCSCEVEDIYFARNTLKWNIDWIKENFSQFNYHLEKEKRKRDID